MCVGFCSLDHDEYSLVLCTNRDEFLSRPTEPAHWHSFKSSESPIVSVKHELEAKVTNPEVGGEGFVLSGVDTVAGGTWFGINKRGEVALLTNITEPGINMQSSRGHLCSSFLCRNRSGSNSPISQFVTDLITSDMRYAGFNLLLLAPSHISCSKAPRGDTIAYDSSQKKLSYDVTFLSNGGAGNPIVTIPKSQWPDFRGISNGTPTGIDPFTGLQTESEWPKVSQGRKMLSEILAKHDGEDVLVERLFDLLRNKTHSPPGTRQALQETILVDPVDMAALRRGLSFAQIHHRADDISSESIRQETTMPDPGEASQSQKEYATRLSTVLLVRKSGEVLFIERDVWISHKDGRPVLAEHNAVNDLHERKFRFRLE